MVHSDEVEKIKERYAKRASKKNLYSMLRPSSYLAEQERERYLIKCIKSVGIVPFEGKRVLEIGAGEGNNILFLIKLGFDPRNIVVNELLPERVELLKRKLPDTVKIIEGNALDLPLDPQSFDIIFQSMVFSSILDEEFKRDLAEYLWSLLKPGGGVIWYDFVYNNPNNPDVKGIGFRMVKSMFPRGEIFKWRLTLAPPIARMIPGGSDFIYKFLCLFPFLRTHLLCWIRKK